jgi:hypothetical protein
MRGEDEVRGPLSSQADVERQVRHDHAPGVIRGIVNAALVEMSAEIDMPYPPTTRVSIPPERLLRALQMRPPCSTRWSEDRPSRRTWHLRIDVPGQESRGSRCRWHRDAVEPAPALTARVIDGRERSRFSGRRHLPWRL